MEENHLSPCPAIDGGFGRHFLLFIKRENWVYRRGQSIFFGANWFNLSTRSNGNGVIRIESIGSKERIIWISLFSTKGGGKFIKNYAF